MHLLRNKRARTWAAVLIFIVTALLGTAVWRNGPGLGFKGGGEGGGNAALLNGPYTDWRQQEIPFGNHSYYYAPWRSYMDTQDAKRFHDALGIGFNVSEKEADATAQVLKEAGIQSARIEIGWNNISYDNETKLVEPAINKFTTILQALKKNGIRPLILLNANSGLPAPNKRWKVKVERDANAGDRVIYLDQVKDIVPYYTGLTGMAYQSMYPVITKLDAKTGRCELSAPLPKDIPAGDLDIVKLKYQPFSGVAYKGGKMNPAAQETVNGWMRYLKTVTSFARDVLATKGTSDAGFDLEVWNEYTFGSQFIDIKNYYDPPLEFSENLSYKKYGMDVKGGEVILPLTADFISDPANGLPGVSVISGFSNQRPWENGTQMGPGMAGFSRHYYTGYDSETSMIEPDSPKINKDRVLSALGSQSGKDGNAFIPNLSQALPERWFYAYQTEFVVRDIQPFPSVFSNHYRYANPGNGKPAEVWMTETNFNRNSFAKEISEQTGTDPKDPRMAELMHHIGAKTTLRIYTFYSHKGIDTVEIYSAKGGDNGLGVIPQAFFDELARSGYQLTDAARAAVGPQLKAVARTSKLLDASTEIDAPRPLKVDKVEEFDPRLVFKGDGTPQHPDRYNRDDLAILPFQLDEKRFAIGYYVVTRDMTKAWAEEKDPLNPARYDMPPQTFEVTLSNIAGRGAKIYAYDPLKDERVPAKIVRSEGNSLTVRMETVDYPRFLMVEEAKDQPMIKSPKLAKTGNGAVFSFTPNVNGIAYLSWGPYPNRTQGTFKEQFFQDDSMQNPLSTREVDHIDYGPKELPGRKGTYRWVGTLSPTYTGTYSFLVESDGCNIQLLIDGKKVIDGCKNGTSSTGLNGSIGLKAGESYTFRMVYSSTNDLPRSVSLYWASDLIPRILTAPAADPKKVLAVNVHKGKKVEVPIPGLSVGEGVKLRLFGGGSIYTQFPQWDYDVKGALWDETIRYVAEAKNSS